MIIPTLLLSSASIIILLSRRANGFYRFNTMFLEVFGLNQKHPSWLRWLTSSLLGTAAASLLLVLLINLADTVLQLTLPSGIGLDPLAVSLLIGFVILSGLLAICAAAVAITSPIASPIALAILAALHSFAYRLTSPLSLVITGLFFCSILIGAVCTFISLYLIFRRYVISRILQMRTSD